MTKDEMKDRISMVLEDPVLQQGFEIICKENAEQKEQINELAEKWCVENMDCCKSDNACNEEIPYFSDEERCIAKSAHADGIRKGISIAINAIEKSKSDISESVTKAKLDKAKEIIEELLNSCFGYNSKTVNYEVKAKAEKFLKEISE